MVKFITLTQQRERTFEMVDRLKFVLLGERYYFGTHRENSKEVTIAYFRENKNSDVSLVYSSKVKLNLFDRILRTSLWQKTLEMGRIAKENIIQFERQMVDTREDAQIYDMQFERMQRNIKK